MSQRISHNSFVGSDSDLSEKAGLLFLIATVLAIILTLSTHILSTITPVILIVLASGVIVLGLPHGALDPMVAKQWLQKQNTNYGMLAFYLAYLFIAAAYIGIWLIAPTLGLVSFLLISAFHFGSDWESRGSTLSRFAYGLTIIALPATLHATTVSAIFRILGADHLQIVIRISAIIGPIAAIIGIAAAVHRFKKYPHDLGELCAIIVGALLLNPLVFFGLYFCLLHSPRHLFETSKQLGVKNIQQIVRATGPIVLATILLALLAVVIMPKISFSYLVISVIFIGLAALTLPHMILEYITNR